MECQILDSNLGNAIHFCLKLQWDGRMTERNCRDTDTGVIAYKRKEQGKAMIQLRP